MAKTFTVENPQLGTLTIDPDKVTTFPEGIIGFEDLKQFAIIDLEEYKPFQWLLSIDDPEISFPIISPLLVVDTYEPDISRAEAYNLGEFTDTDLLLYAIVTIRPEMKRITANLKGPIIINQILRLGQQIVLADDKYLTNHDFFKD